jgi:hypothetical protein
MVSVINREVRLRTVEDRWRFKHWPLDLATHNAWGVHLLAAGVKAGT